MNMIFMMSLSAEKQKFPTCSFQC